MTNEVENNVEKSDDEIQNIGELLRNTRLKSGKTLNDVAKDLCIRRAYLEAIEHLEYQMLPPEPYGLGYVRNYANYLGLNSARIVQIFRETVFPKPTNKKSPNNIHKNAETSAPKPLHLVISFIGLAILALFWGFYSSNNQSIPSTTIEPVIDNTVPEPIIVDDDVQENSEADNNNQEIISEDEDNNPQDEAAEEENILSENKTSGKPEVKIVCIGDSWIEIKHEDKTVLAGVYTQGFEYIVPFEKDVMVSVGKRKNVQFYVDGKLTDVIKDGKQTKIKLDTFLQKR